LILIFTPTILKNQRFFNIEHLLIDIKYNKTDLKLVNKAYFLLRSLLYEGSRKCIVYLTSIKNSEIFKNIIIWMQKLLNIKVNSYQIDCNTTKTKRVEYINNFIADTNISLMLNVQILNEGIDIPICDSVFITDPNNNIENLIQRMSRSNRITNTKDKCTIYLWCNEKKVDKILNYINENTNNELINKIFKINFDKIDKPLVDKYINKKIDIIDSNKNNTKLIEYIKIYTKISNDFIDDFFTFYKENTNEDDIIIDLNLVAK
jgi:predicted helicase